MRYPLKTPYRDGTTHVLFEPVDFIARLAALVPKPRVNLTHPPPRGVRPEQPRPRTGHPGPARAAIRDVFIGHVIGGKGLSRGSRFARLVACATPDAVLAGVEVVADVLGRAPGAAGDILVLDVGGATTDVYSVLDPGDGPATRAVGALWRGRTVEGDLGMRSSAPDVVAAARAERLLDGAAADRLEQAARRRRDDVAMLPAGEQDTADDLALARLAATVAVRRHARPGPEGGRDLTRVGLVVGSGGVLRHAAPGPAAEVISAVLGDYSGGWPVPAAARALIDRRYLLAPIGLLAITGRADLARAVAAQLLART